MSPFYDYHHTVTDDEIDAQGHVHNLRYLQWTLWAANEHSRCLGWNAQAALEEGIGWVVRGHDAIYRVAALAGDQLVVRTWVSELTRVASRRRYLVCRPSDQKVLTRVETRWAMVDLRRRRAIDIPAAAVRQMQVLQRPPGLPWETA